MLSLHSALLALFVALRHCLRTASLVLNLFLRKQLVLFQEGKVNQDGPTTPRVGLLPIWADCSNGGML
jgi:hypothetical protein